MPLHHSSCAPPAMRAARAGAIDHLVKSAAQTLQDVRSVVTKPPPSNVGPPSERFPIGCSHTASHGSNRACMEMPLEGVLEG